MKYNRTPFIRNIPSQKEEVKHFSYISGINTSPNWVAVDQNSLADSENLMLNDDQMLISVNKLKEITWINPNSSSPVVFNQNDLYIPTTELRDFVTTSKEDVNVIAETKIVEETKNQYSGDAFNSFHSNGLDLEFGTPAYSFKNLGVDKVGIGTKSFLQVVKKGDSFLYTYIEDGYFCITTDPLLDPIKRYEKGIYNWGLSKYGDYVWRADPTSYDEESVWKARFEWANVLEDFFTTIVADTYAGGTTVVVNLAMISPTIWVAGVSTTGASGSTNVHIVFPNGQMFPPRDTISGVIRTFNISVSNNDILVFGEILKVTSGIISEVWGPYLFRMTTSGTGFKSDLLEEGDSPSWLHGADILIISRTQTKAYFISGNVLYYKIWNSLTETFGTKVLVETLGTNIIAGLIQNGFCLAYQATGTNQGIIFRRLTVTEVISRKGFLGSESFGSNINFRYIDSNDVFYQTQQTGGPYYIYYSMDDSLKLWKKILVNTVVAMDSEELEGSFYVSGSKIYIARFIDEKLYLTESLSHNFNSTILKVEGNSVGNILVQTENGIHILSNTSNGWIQKKIFLHQTEYNACFTGSLQSIYIAAKEGLYLLSWQELISEPDRSVGKLTDNFSYWESFVNANISMLAIDNYLYLCNGTNNVVIFDSRNGSFWKLVFDYPVTSVDRDLVFRNLVTSKAYEYSDIPAIWKFKTQAMHFNSIDRYKDITRIEVKSLVGEEKSITMASTLYRKEITELDSASDVRNGEEIFSIFKRNHLKVLAYQFEMTNNKEDLVPSSIKLLDVGIRIRYGEEIR